MNRQAQRTVNTKRARRRSLRLESLADALAEARALVHAASQGRVHATGNWTLGQALGHLAAWIEYDYDGYPMKPTLLLRLMGRLLKGRMLAGP